MYIYKPKDCKVPIKVWAEKESIESEALEQIENAAKLPFVFPHVALMPDGHLGYGIPIGGVVACENVIVPNFVGVDIGCGMIAVKTSYSAKEITEEDIKKIIGEARKVIPVGFAHHQKEQEWSGFDCYNGLIKIISQEISSARKQLGTLGGGNHFIEIQKGDDGYIWLMVHSGSRNFGYKIAREYHNKAKLFCDRWYSNIPNLDLAFLPMETEEAQQYWEAMNYAMLFAAENRNRIMGKLKNIVKTQLNCEIVNEINIHHNYASKENHFGKNVIVHRKGATNVRRGQLGIIPGSMGTPSYIVEGLGNPESFNSCSHGAGRKMGRMNASRTLKVEDCDKAMEGIVFGRWGKNRHGEIDLGEAPQAYKDINDVINQQLDLIKPIVKLLPLGVIKG